MMIIYIAQMSKDIYNSLIKKPWGEEHCIFRGKDLSIWLLKIAPNQKTSLHCHPLKKTGLIILNGTVRINLLERQFELNGLNKINLRNQQFHQTHNISDEPIYLVEVETPDIKTDLIRISDDYGRTGEKFESEDEWNDNKSLFTISNNKINTFKRWNFKKLQLKDILQRDDITDKCMIILLHNNAFKSDENLGLCDYGDVFNFPTLLFLSERFTVIPDAECMLIWEK